MKEIIEEKEISMVLEEDCGCEESPESSSSECLSPLDVCKYERHSNRAYLDVIAVISNPARYQRRYDLFNEFCERMSKEPRVRLMSVELQDRNRCFKTNATLKLRTKTELWHKENLINLGVQHLPPDWEYMAWIDTDLFFQNTDWVSETIEQLQSYAVVQLFSHAVDLGPKGEILKTYAGFAYQYVNGEEYNHRTYTYWHPGFAWAMRRDMYNKLGGLIEFCIIGSADYHMALAFIGLIEKSLKPKLHKHYKYLCRVFQDRCDWHLRKNIGFVHGTVLHQFHGDKKNRKYNQRWEIIINHEFDPLVDIKKDCQGLWQLEETKIKLRDDIKMYFRQRNEDSTDHNEEYTFVKSHWI